MDFEQDIKRAIEVLGYEKAEKIMASVITEVSYEVQKPLRYPNKYGVLYTDPKTKKCD